MARILVGMSGGVDSAVAALLLKQAGHEVVGVTLRTWESGGSRCCAIDEARDTARVLGIPYHVLNCASDFERKVERPFVEQYLQGVTPNPCVLCNPAIKWEWLLYAANVFQADVVASGHYASVVRKGSGRFTIRQAADRKKDQSYMLYRLTQDQLAKTVFPLEALSKEKVRHIAGCAGLPSAKRTDSQEVCFVTQDGYADYIRAHAPEKASKPGNIVDEAGRILGTHRGLLHYTVGQRRGLGLALGHPVYVKSLRPETNEVVIAEEKGLYCDAVICGDLQFLSIPGISDGETIRATVKVRYLHTGTEASIAACGTDRVRIRFDDPVRAPAPGQSAVFYDREQCVIGGGILLPETE